MDNHFYAKLAAQSIAGEAASLEDARAILTSPKVELLPLLNAAFDVRQKFTGKAVKIHIINNAQNGNCREDCHYCAQAKTSTTDIEDYPLKPDDEILAEAKNAYEKGAFRYCMVFAGRGPSMSRVEHLARLIRLIKSTYNIQICVSCGLLNADKAKLLKKAGLDRLNHNLNTSREHYPEICTTHTYDDRLTTLQAARREGIKLCSGMIVGMKETTDDVIEVAMTLRELKVESIPVNFLIPITGSKMNFVPDLTPQYCLRVLCLFRVLNPRAEIRVAAGREIHLRSMEVMALYPANSLFLDGYLNTKGEDRLRTLQMIRDAGFTVESDHPLEELIDNEKSSLSAAIPNTSCGCQQVEMKDINDLRPALNQPSK
ncbi:MAG: biotin synthase BioB [Candidatus Omnitrophota bacterium]|nr:biotin synthase BioB [Candidatus Omnitrophota bacterium]